MNVIDIIKTKRDGGELTEDQISWFITEFSKGGSIPDEQAAALAMAIYHSVLSLSCSDHSIKFRNDLRQKYLSSISRFSIEIELDK